MLVEQTPMDKLEHIAKEKGLKILVYAQDYDCAILVDNYDMFIYKYEEIDDHRNHGCWYTHVHFNLDIAILLEWINNRG